MKKVLLVTLLLLTPACAGSVQQNVKHEATVGDSTALALAEAADDVEMAAYKAGKVTKPQHHDFSVEMVKVYQAIRDTAVFAKGIQPGQPVDFAKSAQLGISLTAAISSAVGTLPQSEIRDSVQAKLNQAGNLATQLVGGK